MTALREAAKDVVDVWDCHGTALALRGWIDILRAALAAPQAERSNYGALSWDVAMRPDVAKWITANPPRIEIAPQAEQPARHVKSVRDMFPTMPKHTAVPLTEVEIDSFVYRSWRSVRAADDAALFREFERAVWAKNGIVGGGE